MLRSEYLKAIKLSLIHDNKESIDISDEIRFNEDSKKIGLKGMGGIGKTVLAIAIARDEDIRKFFEGGVYWITIGQQSDIVARQRQLAKALGEISRPIIDSQDGRACLSELLADKKCLLILDDVWRVEQVWAFDLLGTQGRMLITTRDGSVIRGLGVSEFCVDFLSNSEALKLLSYWSGEEIYQMPAEAKDVVKECGNLPLALSIIGAMIRGRFDGWKVALRKLRTANLQRINQDLPGYPHSNLLSCFQVSVDALDDLVREQYINLAVFPPDILIPSTAIFTMWMHKGLNENDAEDLLRTLVDLSLAKSNNQGMISMHDLLHDFLINKAADLNSLHQDLLDAYSEKCPNGWPSGPNDGYFFQYLAYHLIQSDKRDEFIKLYFNDRWIKAKLKNAGFGGLISELGLLSEQEKSKLGISIEMASVDIPLVDNKIWVCISLGDQFKQEIFNLSEKEISILINEHNNKKYSRRLDHIIEKYHNNLDKYGHILDL
jgi:hypothetical protein